MEAFNQVMMDQLLELGFEPEDPEPFVPGAAPHQLGRNLDGYTGDRRASLTWWPPGTFNVPWRVVHDFGLDERDLGEELPDHSVWFRPPVFMFQTFMLGTPSRNVIIENLGG